MKKILHTIWSNIKSILYVIFCVLIFIPHIIFLRICQIIDKIRVWASIYVKNNPVGGGAGTIQKLPGAVAALLQYKIFITVGSSNADYLTTNYSQDDQAINAAIVYASGLGGGRVMCKDEEFTIDDPILPGDNVWLSGVDMYATKFAASSSLRAGIVDDKSARNADSTLNNFIISDLELDGTNMIRDNIHFYKGINSANWVKSKILNIYCHDTTATGIGPDDLQETTIDRCVVFDCGTTGQNSKATLTSDNTNPSNGDTVAIGSLYAGQTLTSDGVVPSDGDTVTVGSTVYTFRNVITLPFDVYIGTTAAEALDNLYAAVNLTAGAGTKYGTGTTAHPTVSATTNTNTTQRFTAKINGTSGNAIATTETSSHLSFGAATLTGGTDITYTFVNSLALAYDVLIGVDADTTLTNLAAAINQSAGAGTLYGTGTVANPQVSSGAVIAHAIIITADAEGITGNTIAVSETSSHLSFSSSTLTNGTSQPIGHNGIGIASGGNYYESVIVSNCVVGRSANNDYLIEADNSVTGTNALYMFMNNVSIDSRHAGFRNTGTPNVSFINNAVYSPATNAFRCTNATAAHIATNTLIRGNLIVEATSYGIYLDSTAYDYIIDGNVIRDGLVEGIISGASNGSIINNTIHDNGSFGINLGAYVGATAALEDVIVANNRVYNNGKLISLRDGIRLYCSNNDLNNITVTGNRCFDNQSTKTQRYGIILASDATHTMSNILVANNSVAGNGTAGILKQNTSPGISVKNNPGFNPECSYAVGNVTGTATFNRLNGDFQTATLTGDTTFAVTASTIIGDEIVLEITQDGTGGWAISWPVNVKLSGGSLVNSKAAGAIDVITFSWDGSNWREKNRSLAVRNAVDVVSTGVNYQVTDANDIIRVTVPGKIVTLHSAVTAAKKRYTIKNTSNGNISFATTSSQTVDGSTTGTIIPNQALEVIPNGSNWEIY